MKGHQSLDHWIVASATVVLGAALYLLFDDRWLFQIGQRQYQDLEAIGKVVEQKDDVRRKIRNTFSWDRVVENADLFEEDNLFIGDSSEATLKMGNGADLEIGPNSLIALKRGKAVDSVVVDIRYGSFAGKIENNQKIQVIHGGEVTEIAGQGSAFLLNTREQEGVEISVVAGAAKIASASSSVEVTKNQSTQISRLGTIGQIRENPIELASPSHSAVLWKKPDDPVEFRWLAKRPFSRFEIQVALDPRFSRLIYKNEAAASPLMAKIPQPNGALYWRVFGLERESQEGERKEGSASVGRFSLYENSPPQLRYPGIGEKVFLNIKREKGDATAQGNLQREVRLGWVHPGVVRTYRLQLGRDRDYSESIADVLTPATSQLTAPLSPGRYFWRVKINEAKGFSASQESGWSESGNFEIIARNLDKPLASPDLKSPEIFRVRFDYYTVSDEKGPREEKVLVSSPPLIQWSPVADASHYYVEIAKEQDFGNSLVSSPTAGPHFRWDNPELGGYYWRVKAVDVLDQPGESSPVGRFQVIKEPPQVPELLEPQIERVLPLGELDPGSPERKVELQWSSVQGVKEYHVVLSEQRDFSQPLLDQRVRQDQTLWMMKRPGNYYWQVQSIDGQGDRSEYSRVGVIKILPADIPAPIVTAKDAIRVISDSDLLNPVYGSPLKNPPQFSWEKSSFVNEYEMEISLHEDFKKPLLRKRSQKSQFLWTEATAGFYFFRVRAFGNNGKISGFSEVQKIELTLNPLIPVTATEIKRFVASQQEWESTEKPLRLEWLPTVIAHHFEVQTSQSSSFEGALSREVVGNSINYVPKKKESLYWRVRPFNSRNQPLAPFSVLRGLRYLSKLGIENPIPKGPKNDAEFTIVSYLPNVLILNWEPVPSAERYRIQISQTEDFSQIIAEGETKSTSYLVNEKPPSGRIYWRVRAETKDLQSSWGPKNSFLVK